MHTARGKRAPQFQPVSAAIAGQGASPLGCVNVVRQNRRENRPGRSSSPPTGLLWFRGVACTLCYRGLCEQRQRTVGAVPSPVGERHDKNHRDASHCSRHRCQRRRTCPLRRGRRLAWWCGHRLGARYGRGGAGSQSIPAQRIVISKAFVQPRSRRWADLLGAGVAHRYAACIELGGVVLGRAGRLRVGGQRSTPHPDQKERRCGPGPSASHIVKRRLIQADHFTSCEMKRGLTSRIVSRLCVKGGETRGGVKSGNNRLNETGARLWSFFRAPGRVRSLVRGAEA